ncbi:bifunctional helix-turn-helix domain-containing protein/methylated-DNA--[protein]-cysteine S-methyltransferase [Pedobacter arcticus]|uniref:bifunctional helix-turn-helix domain-containing protein/methylated-DNA--[protein]-cysteine S-methyltransferase n=1 Tax=Pedobacter arcticus TaxID=752140 RepID=UPI0002FCA03D|nr:methylated-DNA--[protein]-cysteine S-methyltransferase [Pedobacter arcticus]
MKTETGFNYQLVAKAIAYLVDNFKQQPSLEQIAEHVNLSPFHFQKIFSDWAGVSPKKFAQYLNVNYAKQLLHKNETLNLFDTALETGLSGTSRLYDLFVKIEGMTPGEFKNGGQALHINYSFTSSYFGDVLIASTTKGICYLAFYEDSKLALELLKTDFPKADFKEVLDDLQQSVIYVLQQDFTAPQSIKLHLKGTDFQLKVWEALLNIPFGELNTYGSIALEVGSPNAARAVGTAIGNNPVAFLIPCHRVIQNSGKLGGYMWGLNRKTAMLGWEASKINKN